MSKVKRLFSFLGESLELEQAVKSQLTASTLKIVNWVPIGGMFVGLFFSIFWLLDFYVSYFNTHLPEGQSKIVALGKLTANGLADNIALFFVFFSILPPMFMGLVLGGLALGLFPGLFHAVDPELLQTYRVNSLKIGIWLLVFGAVFLVFGLLGIVQLSGI